MRAHLELLTEKEQIQELAKALRAESIIAFDTEFIRESTFYPQVEIIQVATDKESWLVDAQAFHPKKGRRDDLKPLLDVFEDPNILKIVHAAQGDQECLSTGFGVVAKPSLDTSIAASLCGYGDGVGLGNLLRAVLGVEIKKGHARTNWSVRPLPSQLLEYAHADVQHLVALGKALLKDLESRGRKAWGFELSSKWEDPTLYEPDPKTLADKLARGGRLDSRGYAALVELIRWREGRVRQINVPRRWVADDQVIMDLAHVRPKDMEHLAAFRGLNKAELKNSGPVIIEAIQKAAQAKDVSLPETPRPMVASESESQVLDLLKCYVGILADEHEIAIKHLVTSAQLLPILRAKIEKPEHFVQQGLLSAGAAELIGEEVIEFLKGRRALSVRGKKVQIVKIDSTPGEQAR